MCCNGQVFYESDVMYSKLSQRSFFGRIEDNIICFRDYLTFSSVTKMLSTSEAREKRVLFKQCYRANDPPLFLFRPGTTMVLFGKNQFEIGFEFEFLNIQRFNMAISKNFYENILWNCRFIRCTCNFRRNLAPLWIAHFYLLPRTLISCSFYIQEILFSTTNFTLHC